MKRYILAAGLTIVSLALSANAQMWPLSEGTQEIQARGVLEWDGPRGDYTELGLGYGYFLAEGIEVGPRFAIASQDDNSFFSVDAFMEYHYPLADNVAPYAGVALGLLSNDDAEDSAAVTLQISAGCKFFLIEDLALDISINHTQATGDVFLSENEYKSHRSNMQLGLRFFY